MMFPNTCRIWKHPRQKVWHGMKPGVGSNPAAGAYRVICLTCTLGGDALPQRMGMHVKQTVQDRLRVSKSLLL